MLTPGKHYRIKTSTIALAPDAKGRRVAITIPEGGIVKLMDGTIEGSHSLHVEWEGTTCEVFTQDLSERGEEVKSASDRLPF